MRSRSTVSNSFRVAPPLSWVVLSQSSRNARSSARRSRGFIGTLAVTSCWRSSQLTNQRPAPSVFRGQGLEDGRDGTARRRVSEVLKLAFDERQTFGQLGSAAGPLGIAPPLDRSGSRRDR
jgi:hypothetical protein